MGYIESLLAQEERMVFVTRQHWFSLLSTILIDLGLVVVILAFSIGGFLISPPYPLFGLLLLLIPVAHFLFRLVAWLNEQYIVTNRRVIEVKGTVRKYVSDSSLEKVNDVMMEQSALGRLLDYGNVRIITGSDIGVNAFRHIAHPIRFKIAMLDQKSSLGRIMSSESKAESREEVVPKEVPDMLDRLESLKQRGVITEEEFEQEVKQLLERL